MRQTLFILVLIILIIVITTDILIIARVQIFLMEILDLVIPEAAMEAEVGATKWISSPLCKDSILGLYNLNLP